MFVVDTNILLYAAERSFPEHASFCTRDMDFHRFDFVQVIEPDAAV